jgi:hypothetical protein
MEQYLDYCLHFSPFVHYVDNIDFADIKPFAVSRFSL